MKLELNEQVLLKFNITPQQFIVLHGLYYSNYYWIESILGRSNAISIRNELVNSKFVTSDLDVKFKQTELNNDEVRKLLGIKGEDINFWEWYVIYPIKVGTRVLRATTNTAKLAEKHQEKYLKRIKTQEQHEKAILATEAFIDAKRRAGELKFLPNIETVLNNATWEIWQELVQTKGQESMNWNDTSI